MSEHQRYEFMAIDRPLTQAQMNAVQTLSKHIEVSSTTASIEYHHGDFGHNPISVLHSYFDVLLYWANWGSIEFALRFPHGSLPADLIDGYDCDEFVQFIQHPQYDILDLNFGEMEAPDEWIDYELKSLVAIRSELMTGDLRALYIAWLASQMILDDYEEEDEEEDTQEDEQEDGGEETKSAPLVPPGLGTLTVAQQALVDLLQVPQELIDAAKKYNDNPMPLIEDDFSAWIELLPQDRRSDYLLSLACNEPGLNSLLVKELRTLGRGEMHTTPSEGAHIPYSVILVESRTLESY